MENVKYPCYLKIYLVKVKKSNKYIIKTSFSDIKVKHKSS